MALSITEAHAVNHLLGFFLSTPGPTGPVAPETALKAAVALAGKARRVLLAGLTPEEVAELFAGHRAAEVERLRAERNNAVATVAEQAQRLTAREREHNADRAELARTRAMLTDARDRCDEAEAKLHQVATAPVHTAADGRKFVLVSDLAAVLLPPAPADEPTPEQARIRAALREAGEAIYGGCDCPTPCSCAADAATLTAQLAEEAGDLDG